jgi:hypothetical protein
MAPQSAEEKLNYLMACIKHSSTSLTIDFEAVGKEFNIGKMPA